jgi:hypothetical protein
MAETISAAYQAATQSIAYTSPESVSIEDLAARKANPSLWSHKYRFALSVLRLSPQEAMAVADNADEVFLAAKREFHLNGDAKE